MANGIGMEMLSFGCEVIGLWVLGNSALGFVLVWACGLSGGVVGEVRGIDEWGGYVSLVCGWC